MVKYCGKFLSVKLKYQNEFKKNIKTLYSLVLHTSTAVIILMKPINQSNFLTKIIFENRNFLYNIFIVSKPVKFLSLNQLGGFYTIKTLVTISLNPFVLRLTVLK